MTSDGSPRAEGALPATSRDRVIEVDPDSVWEFVSDPSNLRTWWPRVVGVEFLQGEPGQDGLRWTMVLESDSGRRMRLDYGFAEAVKPSRVVWFHELEGTRFGEHLNRQETTVTIEPAGAGSRVTITSDGELKGAAKLASFALKSDQKKMLEQALDGLSKALGHDGEDS